MPKLKPAVYQVSEPGGVARLVCVLVSALEDGLRMEDVLRARFGRLSGVTFLGRFDKIEAGPGVAHFLDITPTEEESLEGTEGSGEDVRIRTREARA